MESSFNLPMFVWLMITIAVLYLFKLTIEVISPPYCEEEQKQCDHSCEHCPHVRLIKKKKK